MSTIFAALQSTYSSIELALFKDGQQLGFIVIDKHQASAMLIPVFAELLTSHSLSLKDLAFLAVNKGPAPFTTLRTVIATANGLAFATGIPLIGVTSIDALVKEYTSDTSPVPVALLKAFHEDVYYGYWQDDRIEVGCLPHAQALELIAEKITDKKILFVGNAAHMYERQIITLFGERAIFAPGEPATVSLPYVARLALESWCAHANIEKQLMPLYLKKPVLFTRS